MDIGALKSASKMIKDMRDRNKDKDRMESYEVIIESIDKQIPDVPKYQLNFGVFRKMKYRRVCPRCDVYVERLENKVKLNNYCWNCGQRLDWDS